jgi:hypothetical protein
MHKLSFIANGNIRPSRFVKLDTTADGKVLECDAGEGVIGVSHESTRRTPYSSLDDGYAAIAGEQIEVYAHTSECLLELGGTVTRGDRLKADADGKGVSSSTDLDNWGAIALQSGVSGNLVKVKVQPYSQISAA